MRNLFSVCVHARLSPSFLGDNKMIPISWRISIVNYYLNWQVSSNVSACILGMVSYSQRPM